MQIGGDLCVDVTAAAAIQEFVLQVAPDFLSGSISTGKAELVAVNAKETTFDQVISLWGSEAGVNTKRY